MTAAELIKSTLQDLGVYGAGEDISAEDAVDSLERLNDLCDGLGLERMMMYAIVRTTKVLAANTASYTIGSGGDINIVRPTFLDHAGLIIDTSATIPTEIPLRIFTEQEWAGILQKTQTAALAMGIRFDHAWSAGLGRIYVWPIPTVGTTELVLYTPGEATSEFADLTTEYTFPKGYRRFFRKALKVELADLFEQPVTERMTDEANEAKGNIKRANFRMTELAMDPAIAGSGHFYNIETDS